MERISKKTVAMSRPFRFLIGPQEEEFTIHAALVAHQSSPLRALVQAAFKASDLCVKWNDINVTTFVSFWQFVYTGDYDTPEHLVTVVSDTTAGSEDKVQGVENDTAALPETSYDYAARPETPDDGEVPVPARSPPSIPNGDWSPVLPKSKKKKTRMTKRESAWMFFKAMSDEYTPLEDEKIFKEGTAGLLHHAEVYVLGDRYGILRLMNRSWQKIHQALISVKIDERNIGGLLAVLRFCFEGLVPYELEELLIHYASAKVEHLWKYKEFSEFLESCGRFSKALVGTMIRVLD
ncbi:hypothetical protein AK830_g7834 [Neonectria ditissima]|uniref:BTB domain-containing protein n=1 Tax=Neonectria ditissima TaxID=78410 RepID=A0A0P7ALS0_9HYPO|nr:hypothetical protein AK830_g7834 [Neonectria ditissima]